MRLRACPTPRMIEFVRLIVAARGAELIESAHAPTAALLPVIVTPSALTTPSVDGWSMVNRTQPLCATSELSWIESVDPAASMPFEVEVIVKAIEAVMGGSTHYPAGLMRALARRQQQPSLTARETEVLALMAKGLTSKAIARFMGIDFRTVFINGATGLLITGGLGYEAF